MQPQTKTQPQNPSCFIVTKNAAVQVVPSGALTLITFDNEHFDVLNEFSVVASHFTARRTGYYLFHAQTQVLIILANGMAGINIVDVINARDLVAAYHLTAGEIMSMQVQGVIHLNAGDTVEVEVLQMTGLNITLSNNTYQTKFTGHRLS